jgi:hypothetical protein
LIYAAKVEHGFDTALTMRPPTICRRGADPQNQALRPKIAHRGIWVKTVTVGRDRVMGEIGGRQAVASFFKGITGGLQWHYEAAS